MNPLAEALMMKSKGQKPMVSINLDDLLEFFQKTQSQVQHDQIMKVETQESHSPGTA